MNTQDVMTWNDMSRKLTAINGKPIEQYSVAQLMEIEIKELRTALSNSESSHAALQSAIEAQAAEIEQLNKRLEARHYYNGSKGFNDLKKIEELQATLNTAENANAALQSAIKTLSAHLDGCNSNSCL